VLLRAGNPTPWTGPTGNNTYLLTGATPALIDAGVGHPDHIQSIVQGLQGRDLAAILITHNHFDHVEGVPSLLERWPAARIWNSTDRPGRDNELLAAGDGVIRAVHTPGHAPDHFCLIDERPGEVYCGDLVRLGGTIAIPATRGGSLVQYLESLRRIRALKPRRLLPAHGPVIEDPMALIDDYLRHRAERERQVLEALAAGCARVEEIVLRIYGEIPAPLARAATETVLAHLIKLRDEGRAADSGGMWRTL
jgi:ribonuclease/clavin/mitogillin